MSLSVYFLPMVPRVVVIAFEGAQTLDVTGPAEVFASVRRVRPDADHRVLFAALGGGQRTLSSGLRVRTCDLRRLRPRPDDTVVVAGGDDPVVRAAVADRRLARWLRASLPVVRRVASVCSGAFVLAAAGLLDGRRAATHWSACAQLARLFPAVTVDANAIFVRDGKLWTSAGVTTGIDMALAMVEEDMGAAVADAVAARLVLYVRRPGFQSQFSDALVAQSAASDGLARAIAWARAHPAQADVEALARRAGMSGRTFHRRCVEQLRTTPAKLIEKVRVELARTLLTGRTRDRRARPAKVLAQQCGFGSVPRMNRAFARELGMPVRAYGALHAGSSVSR
jgi:transcriptional regulator GlxA family with amidase domain